jgi:uncharacterized protein DUF4760
MEFFARCGRVGAECLGDLETWKVAASLAPIGTAIFAVSAALIALLAIRAQRDIARRRAAIDFFLKAEMDDKMVEVYKKFETAIRALHGQPMATFADTPGYSEIRRFLDIQELLAVGIYNKIFDHRICYHYWADATCDAYRGAKPVIDYARNQIGTDKSYEQMCRLSTLWSSKPRFWQRWRD